MNTDITKIVATFKDDLMAGNFLSLLTNTVQLDLLDLSLKKINAIPELSDKCVAICCEGQIWQIYIQGMGVPASFLSLEDLFEFLFKHHLITMNTEIQLFDEFPL